MILQVNEELYKMWVWMCTNDNDKDDHFAGE